jgi:hypothetical protein
MGRDRSIFVLLAALALPGVGTAKEPLRLQPSSKWNVHYAEDSCRMARSFGEGDQKVVLMVDRYQPGDALRLSFIGKPAHTRLNEASCGSASDPPKPSRRCNSIPARSPTRRRR